MIALYRIANNSTPFKLPLGSSTFEISTQCLLLNILTIKLVSFHAIEGEIKLP